MAIISLSGRQYLVGGKEKFTTFKLNQKEGEIFEVKDELSGQKVKLKVLRHILGDKVRVLKFKKTGYKRVFGSRDNISEVEVV